MSETLTGSPAQNYVGGEWRESASGETLREAQSLAAVAGDGRLPVLGRRRRARRGRAAREAFPAWAALPGGQRAAFFGKAANSIEARAEQIAQDMTAEMGKPLRESRLEALRAATILRFAAGEAWRPIGEMYAPSVAESAALHAAPPARGRRPDHAVELPDRDSRLEAGPGAHLRQHRRPQARLRGAAHRAARRRVLRRGRAAGGCPERAHGRRLEGRAPSSSEPRGPRAISFTGSVAVGRAVREEATARDCRVQLELGGHNPLVVMADAELDRAVEAAYAGAFWSAGQKCTATRRILVQDAVYDEFRERMLARVAAGKVGDPADPEVEVGRS